MPTKRLFKLLEWGVVLLMATLVGFMILILFWELEPARPPVDLASVHQETVDISGMPKTEFKAGETVYVRTRQTILRAVPRTINQYLFDEGRQIIAFEYAPTAAIHMAVGTGNSALRALTLPPGIVPGTYSRRVQIVYVLNPLRMRESYELPPVKFTVVK